MNERSRTTLFRQFFLAVLLFTACSGDGDDSSVPPGELQLALEALGLRTIDAKETDPVRPAIFIGGLTDPDGLARDTVEISDCRGDIFDAVFVLDTRSSETTLEAPTSSIQRTLDALAVVESLGLTEITIIGHNTAGLIARAALVAASKRTPAIAANTGVRLITFFTPFAGVPPEVMRAGYPAEFASGTDFIENPGALPINVSHNKINASFYRSNSIYGASSPDAVFFDAQAFQAVDGDPQVRVNSTEEGRNFPFDAQRLLISAYDNMGYPPHECFSEAENDPDALSEEESAALGNELIADYGISGTTTRGITSLHRTTYSEQEFAGCGLIAPTLGGSFDPDKPLVILVHGVGPSPDNFDQLENEFQQQGFNVFRYVYDDAAIPEGYQFADEIDEFTDGHDTVLDASLAFADSAKKLQQLVGVDTVNIVGHSQGGLVVRDALTIEGRGQRTLADMGFTVNFVSVASPFRGVESLLGAPGVLGNFGLELVDLFGTVYHSPMQDPEENFLNGTLGSNICHIKIVTNEATASQDVVSISGQSNGDVDAGAEPFDGSDTGSVVVTAGHVDVIKFTSHVRLISGKILAKIAKQNGQGAIGGGSETSGTTSSSSTNTSSSSSSSSSGSASSSSSSSESSSSSSGASQSGFSCPSRTYNAHDGGCGLTSPMDLFNGGDGTFVSTPFGANGSVGFTVGASNTGVAGPNLIIFGSGGHTCETECESGSALIVRCRNTRGGFCQQRFQ